MTAAYQLPDRLEGADLAGIRDGILSLRGEDLDFDGSGVQRLNGMGLQLILAAFRTWRSDGRTLRLVSPSLPLLEAFTRLELTQSLMGEAA